MQHIKILILAAHPDDECLGAGGTAARLSAEGHNVYVSILGEGHGARTGLEENHTTWISQANAAVKSLGAQLWISPIGFPDNQFDTVSLLEISRRIESMIETVHPSVVYTHHANDLNQDHRLVHQATLIATRPTANCSVKEVYAYEAPSSTEWAFSSPSFCPNVFMEISEEYLKKKIQAMEMYESERREFPHPRSPEALRALATWRGAQVGVMAAEAFELVRWIR